MDNTDSRSSDDALVKLAQDVTRLRVTLEVLADVTLYHPELRFALATLRKVRDRAYADLGDLDDDPTPTPEAPKP